jgi:hypothetical protein
MLWASPRGAAEIRREISCLRAVQAPFGSVFWSFEQRIARLSDELERRAA